MADTNSPSGKVMSAINVTPFVDIVLVLLVVLMVSSIEMVRASIAVDLPRAASKGESVSSTLNIVIDREGRLFLDGAPSSDEALARRVAQEKQRDASVQAVIAADREVVYERVIAAIDILKQGGIKRFALNIERAGDRSRSEPR